MILDFGLEIKEVGESGTIRGMASTFGGDPDDGGDVIMPGAFQKTIAKGGRNGNGILMLMGHDNTQVPGVWTSIKEGTRGLQVLGKLNLNTQLGKETHSLLKMDPPAFRGLSIGFDLPRDKATRMPKKDSFDIVKGVRYIKDTILWEISIVSFPMNKKAKITNVKEAIGFEEGFDRGIEEAETPRELEKFLREAGLSKSEAQYVVKLSRGNLREVGKPNNDGSEELQQILEMLKKENTSLSVYKQLNL